MTVKQTGDTLTIERTAGENKIVSTYKLDGTESVNKMMGRGGAEVETKSTAKWDGSKLTVVTKQAAQDGTVRESSQSWWLEGGNLVVESTRTGREGAPVTARPSTRRPRSSLSIGECRLGRAGANASGPFSRTGEVSQLTAFGVPTP